MIDRTTLIRRARATLLGAAWIPALAFAAAPQDAPTTAPAPVATPAPATTAATAAKPFTPPAESAMPADDFGKTVKLGEQIFLHTPEFAGKYVGNKLTCASCHLDAGRRPDSSPMWAAYLLYPAYRSKNGHVNTFAERLQGCFRYSMNGKAPPSTRSTARCATARTARGSRAAASRPSRRCGVRARSTGARGWATSATRPASSRPTCRSGSAAR